MSEVFNEDRRAWQWVAAEPQTASPTIVPAPASRHEPFPLTDLQKAYWLGRTDYFELGNVGCHVYVEVDLPGLDRRRLQAAWQKLIDRHEMLRAVIRDDGLQQILPHTPHYDIKHLDLREADQSKANFELAAIRDRMSHQVFSPDRWPLFEMRTTELKERTLLHFSCDLLFIDVWSLQILHGELLQLTYQRAPHLPPLEISFRDYVLTAARHRGANSYRRAEQYWLRRLDTLPPAPKLPLAKSSCSHNAATICAAGSDPRPGGLAKAQEPKCQGPHLAVGHAYGSVREGSGGVEPKSAFHHQHNSVPTCFPASACSSAGRRFHLHSAARDS